MKDLEILLKEFDLKRLSKADYLINIKDFINSYKNKNYFFLDVRHEKEYKFFNFPFSFNIPLDKLPDNVDKLPQNRVIIIISNNKIRATIAYVFLKIKGFNQLKILAASFKEVLDNISIVDIL